jgi:RNA polymerase sigma-70 factor (ECF subfamily)
MTFEEEPDAALVAAVVADGDEARFRALYRRHSPALYRLALRLAGGDAAAADDALQESWIRAARRLASFRGDSAFRTWLSGFLVNCCREARRESARRAEEPLGSVEPARSRGDSLRLDLERAIASLPPSYRDVLVLHDVEGYTHEEIGRLLDVEPGTSKSQLSRARRALRAALSPATEAT